LSRKQDVIKDFRKGFIPLITPVVIICLLVAPANLSTALLIGSTSLLLMFIGRASMKHIGLTLGIAAIPVAILVALAVTFYDSEQGKSRDLPSVLETGRIPTWIKRVQNFMY